ncbi:MAG TPA: hypothetical protein VFT59_00075 [Candidatus Saccharimonadales bacterium]|nr:hypothetical protein [Candidatus Saccharimonadales bacterium]
MSPKQGLPPSYCESVPHQDILSSDVFAERHPDWPSISVTFYFSPHGNASDIEGIAPYLEKADILLYENSRAELTERFQQVAAKEADVRPVNIMVKEDEIYGKPIQGSAWEPLLRGIYKSGKAIGSIDLNEHEQHLRDGIVESQSLPVEETFDEALASLGKILRRNADLQNQRETIMAERFEEEITRILDEHPELKEKPRLNVLISIGAYHTRLRHALQEKGVQSEQHFPESPYVYDYVNQLTRTYAYGKEPTRELLEKAYLQALLHSAAQAELSAVPGQYNHDKLERYLRSVVDAFNSEEIQQVYDLYKNQVLSVQLLDGILSSKGLERLREALGKLPSR